MTETSGSALPAAGAQAAPDDLVEVGYVGDAWGIRGWIKVQPHADDPKALLAAPLWWLQPTVQTGVLRSAADAPVAHKVKAAKPHSGTVVGLLAGCAERNAAAALKGHKVFVSRADFPPAADGEYYWVDLIGLPVTNVAGEALGVVADLIDNGAHQILRVVKPGADGVKPVERLIPFVDAYLRDVKPKSRVDGGGIVVDWELGY